MYVTSVLQRLTVHAYHRFSILCDVAYTQKKNYWTIFYQSQSNDYSSSPSYVRLIRVKKKKKRENSSSPLVVKTTNLLPIVCTHVHCESDSGFELVFDLTTLTRVWTPAWNQIIRFRVQPSFDVIIVIDFRFPV